MRADYVRFFQTPISVTLCWLEISYIGSIYTMEIGKCLGPFFPGELVIKCLPVYHCKNSQPQQKAKATNNAPTLVFYFITMICIHITKPGFCPHDFLPIDHKAFCKYCLISSHNTLGERGRLSDLPESGQEINGENQDQTYM